jgi:hypothetical protein
MFRSVNIFRHKCHSFLVSVVLNLTKDPPKTLKQPDKFQIQSVVVNKEQANLDIKTLVSSTQQNNNPFETVNIIITFVIVIAMNFSTSVLVSFSHALYVFDV